jgi:hypothetical protein
MDGWVSSRFPNRLIDQHLLIRSTSLFHFFQRYHIFSALSLFASLPTRKTFDVLEYQKVLKEFDFLARTFLFFEEKEPLR